MKKNSLVKVLILLFMIISVPLIIYFASSDTGLASNIKLKLLDKLNSEFAEESVKTNSVLSRSTGAFELAGGKFQWSPNVVDDGISHIILGNLEYSKVEQYDFHYSYTLRAATYCCDSYWPLIKVKDAEFGEAAGASTDKYGSEHEYNIDQEKSRLPNRNGHLVNIDYNVEGDRREDLYKGLAYLQWQGITNDYVIQRVLWSSWVWSLELGYCFDYMGINYVLENLGVYNEVRYEQVKFYCGRESYVPDDLVPQPYGAHHAYYWGGHAALYSKEPEWIEAGGYEYDDPLDIDGDGTVSVEEQLQGRTEEAWRADIIAGMVASYGLYSRTIQFSTFEYQAVGRNRNMNIVPAEDEIHVYVDQVSNEGEKRLPSYTFGPYMISLKDESGYNYGDEICSNKEPGETLKVKELVYNEIVGGNFGQKEENTFLKAEFKVKAKYRNGRETEVLTTIKPKYDDENAYNDDYVHSYQDDSFTPGGAILVDPEGNALEEGFPEFDEYFYIRYYVDDYINTFEELLEPEITVTYIGNDMHSTGYKFKSAKLSYSCHYNLCKYYDSTEDSDCFGQLFSAYPNFGYDFNLKLNQAFHDKPDGGEIYTYKNYSGLSDEADVTQAISMIEEGIENYSNRYATSKNVKVTWADDLHTDNDTNLVRYRGMRMEGSRTLEQERCDGIYVRGCDQHPAVNYVNPYNTGSDVPPFPMNQISETGQGFLPEYNDIDTFLQNSLEDFTFVFLSCKVGIVFQMWSEQTVDYNGMTRDAITIKDNANWKEEVKEKFVKPKFSTDWAKERLQQYYLDANMSPDHLPLVQISHYTDQSGMSNLYDIEHDPIDCGGKNCTKAIRCSCCKKSDCDCKHFTGEYTPIVYDPETGEAIGGGDPIYEDCDHEWECACEPKNENNRDQCICETHTVTYYNIYEFGDVLFKRDYANVDFNDFYNYGEIEDLDAYMQTQEHYNMVLKAYDNEKLYDEKYSKVEMSKYTKTYYDMDFDSWESEVNTILQEISDNYIEEMSKWICDYIEEGRNKLTHWIMHQGQLDYPDELSADDGAYAGLYIPYITPDTYQEGYAMPFVEEDNDGFQSLLTTLIFGGPVPWKTNAAVKLPNKEIKMYLGGNIMEEVEGMKGDGYNLISGNDAGAGARCPSFLV